MQIDVSSTLTVYHDGRFWVGLAEHVEDGRYGVARIIFGAEPSNQEIHAIRYKQMGEARSSVATQFQRRASPRRPQETRPRGGESPQAAGDDQGAAGARESAGDDEAGIGSSKKPASARMRRRRASSSEN